MRGIDPDEGGGIRGALAGRIVNPGGLVAAVDVRDNKLVATHKQPYDNQSGVLATAGGLVFTATLDGGVVALNDETLEEMWRFDTGIVGVKAPVFTFSVDGKQYVAVVAGGRSGSVACDRLSGPCQQKHGRDDLLLRDLSRNST